MQPNGEASPITGYPELAQPMISPSQETSMSAKTKGVIASIVEIISRERGATIDEIVAILSKKFPDRDEVGMAATARVQANAHATSKVRDAKRGLVYFKKARK